MYINNPYAQAGWHNPQNVYSINENLWRENSTFPPTFGALPSHQDTSSIHKFTFTLFNPDICDCTVRGPNNLNFFDVSTIGHTTRISKPGEQFATIRWTQHPSVEARSALIQQPTAEFLRLSADQKYRTMVVGGRSYAWVPHTEGTYLYSTGPNSPEEFARIRLNGDATMVVLEMTSQAFQAGLFERCILATVLLYSARNLE